MPEQGPSLSPVQFTTSTWSRFEIRENYDKIGVSSGRIQEGELVLFRARLGMQTNPLAISDGADVILQFTPQATGNWGQDGTIGSADLGIYEGYFKIRTKRLDVQVGRLMMSYGDEVVIGNPDWNEKGRAFDGVRAHYKMNKGYVDFFGTQVAEAHPVEQNKFLGGDLYFWGAYAGVGEYMGSGDEKIDLDFYLLGLSGISGDKAVDDTGTRRFQSGGTLFTGGARAKGQEGILDVRAEAALQFGNQTIETMVPLGESPPPSQQALAYMGDIEVGLALSESSRISLGAAIASGDNPETEGNEGWNELFPTGHKFLGLMDVIGSRANILSGNAKLQRGITQNLTLKLDGHVFLRTEDQALPGTPEKGFAGVEVDTQLVQKLGKYTKVRALYGLFIPSTGHYASDDLVSYGELQAGVTF